MKSLKLPRPLTALVCVLFAVAVIFSCKRNEAIFKTPEFKVSEVRSWLNQNGLAYKNETITVQAANGRLLTGKLNWESARQYT